MKVPKEKEKPGYRYNSVELLATIHETLSLKPGAIPTKGKKFYFNLETLNLTAFSMQFYELTNEQSCCFNASINKVGNESIISLKLCWVTTLGTASHPQPGFYSSVLKSLYFVFPKYTVFRN